MLDHDEATMSEEEGAEETEREQEIMVRVRVRVRRSLWLDGKSENGVRVRVRDLGEGTTSRINTSFPI